MKNKIVELVQDCKLVRKDSEYNGHDCWGNSEFSSYKYVTINGKQQKCWDDWYVIHDGKNVEEVTTKFLYELDLEIEEHFNKTGFKTPSEYRAYLKGVEDGKAIKSQNLNQLGLD